MDENKTTPEASELLVECRWLRNQVQIVLILLILVSLTFTLFLVKQVRDVNTGVTVMRNGIESYGRSEGAATDELIRKLVEYGRSHPDFNAIYVKYGLNQVTNVPPKK